MPVGKPIKELIERINTLKAERANWDAWWQSLARYCLPRKAEIITRKASGTEFDKDIYDSTAIESANLFAAGLMGYMTNPSDVWMRMRAREEALQQDEDVATFFDEATTKVLRTLAASNFYEQLHEFFLEYGIFGTAAFYSERDPGTLMRYYCRPIKEVYFDEDESGRLLVVYRIFELTAGQAYGRWGNQAGKSVLEAIKAKKFSEPAEFAQCVGPRPVYDPSKRDRTNKPIFSSWVNVKDQTRVDEGGFEEQPFHVARASKVSWEKHGYAPAMNVLPEIRMASTMVKTLLRASQKTVDPPIILPHEGYTLPLNLNPSGVNYKTQTPAVRSGEEKIEVLRHEGNIPAGREMLDDTRQTIKRAFFADLFLMLQGRDKTMTAYEVSQLMGERMLILGPMLGRLQNELLEPVITRTFHDLLRQGELELPAGLEGEDYTVEYTSVLARAQQLSQVQGIQNYLLTVGEVAKIDPQVLDKINADETADRLAELMGISPKLLATEDQVTLKREQRRQAQELMAKMQMAQAGAQAFKTGGEAAKVIGEATGGGQQA